VNKVTDFATDHPEFDLLRKKEGDPGKLKFNHKYHMTDGIVLTRGGKPFTLNDVPKDLRSKYRRPGQKDTDAVKLDCSSCHTPEGRDEVSREGRPDPAAERDEWQKWAQDYFKRRQEARPHLGG